ncbi:diguanylate cyclase [Helicovermis profundi]|uniref:Diguanylate cyclase n=1 Tax=Helicovermis profundi TaxID=3065157 RepID=A0AAU9EE65_9FIRM|nr:diguanylate cyclase [Clostridia bacterium S502]
MKFINKRYKILREISEDGTGKTYLASDIKKRLKKIFLKVFTLEESNEVLIKDLIKNFIKLKSIASDNIAEIYNFELIEVLDGKINKRVQYFYTYEYYDRKNLVDYQELSYDETRQVIFEVIKVLEYLHFRGFVYRYLSFENIKFLRKDNKIKAVFNNLVHIEMFDKSYRLNLLKCSSFIAPEVLWDSKFFYKSDIFSFGYFLYYLFYKYDIEKSSIYEVYDNIENKMFEIIRKMISTFRNERYFSINEVSKNVLALLRLEKIEMEGIKYNKVQNKTLFVGRKNELNYINSFLNTETSEKKKSIIFYGEKGIGKTKLLNEIYLSQKYLGENVFIIDVVKSESQFFNFTIMLNLIARKIEFDSSLIKKYGADLTKLDPKLCRKFNIEPSKILDGNMENLKISNRIYNFLKELSKLHKIILIIDNIDNFSEYEKNIFTHMNNLDPLSKIKIVSTSDELISSDIFFNECLVNNQVVIKRLMRFNYDESNKYIRELMGINYLPTTFTTKLMRDIGGNPLELKTVINDLFRKKRIYVNEMNTWVIKDVEDLDVIIRNMSKSDGNFLKFLENTSKFELNILRIISSFENAVNLNILIKILNIGISDLDKTLLKYIECGILIKKLNDFGFSIAYKNYGEKKYILDLIDNVKKINMHRVNTAILLENSSRNSIEFDEEIVFQLLFSYEYKKAIDYLVDYADKLSKKRLFAQSIEHLENALDIYTDHEVLEIDFIKILFKIGISYFKNHNYKKAYDVFSEVNSLSKELNNTKEFIDSNIYISKIFNKQLRFEESEKILLENINLSKEKGYTIGEFDSALMLCKTYLKKNEPMKLKDTSIFYINFTEAIDEKKYYSKFLNEYAKYEHMTGNFEEALKNFEQCYEIFSNYSMKEELNVLLNNIGVIYNDYYGLNSKARFYFKKSISNLNINSNIEMKIIYYINIGESFYNDDEYLQSIHYLNKAYSLSEEAEDSYYLFTVSLNKCFLFIKINNYEKAYSILKKLEIDYKTMNNKKSIDNNYYFVHIEYYLSIKNYLLAEIWINKFTAINGKSSNRIKMYSFALKNYKNKLISDSKIIDRKNIISFINTTINLNEIASFRKILFEIIKKISNNREVFAVKEILNLDNALREIYDSDNLKTKRKISEVVFVNNRIKHYNEILLDEKNVLLKEDKWYIYKLIADEYYSVKDYYNAINNYYNALDIIKDLTDKIYIDHKLDFLHNDEVKLDLRNRIVSLKNKVIKNNKKDAKLKYSDMKYSDINDYFDFSSISDFYNDEKFVKKINKSFNANINLSIESIEKLVIEFTLNEKYNLSLILKYFIQKSFADFGYIYITNELGKIVDYIASDDERIVTNIEDFIKKSGSTEKGVLLSKIYYNENNYLLTKEQKSIICLPIKEESAVDDTDKYEFKRESDGYNFTKRTVGYIYLESGKIFNNFTSETLNHFIDINKMVYLMVENYNLKTLSTRDKLTEVLLRGRIEEIFSKELFKSKQISSNFSVVMSDIDKFKNINDTYGHLKGDEVLKRIGKILNSSLRKTDKVGRYGGEEFIMILPNTNTEEAYKICEKIRNNIYGYFLDEGNVLVTMSFGISSYPNDGINEQELVEKADKALYFSKNNGRNLTTVWNKQIENDSERFNRLSGVISGDISNDSRNVQAIINVLDLIKINIRKNDKLLIASKNLLDITEAEYCTIVKYSNDSNLSYTCKKSTDNWIKYDYIDSEFIEKYRGRTKGEYFVNWNNIIRTTIKNEINWNSCIVSPVVINSKTEGLIILNVRISEKEFDANDFNFVESISPIVGAIFNS